jgi:hypothetical protein
MHLDVAQGFGEVAELQCRDLASASLTGGTTASSCFRVNQQHVVGDDAAAADAAAHGAAASRSPSDGQIAKANLATALLPLEDELEVERTVVAEQHTVVAEQERTLIGWGRRGRKRGGGRRGGRGPALQQPTGGI